MNDTNWLYSRWQKMKYRCSHSPTYVERGIVVCDAWVNNFEEFRAWSLANGAKKELELDRVDNDRGYCPENCRWVTHKENCRSGGRSGKFNKDKSSAPDVVM
jgi:hypothetical protein